MAVVAMSVLVGCGGWLALSAALVAVVGSPFSVS